MPESQELSLFYDQLVKEIQLSQTAYSTAEREFNSLTSLFDDEYDNVKMFPQGSYSLGTTIRPLNADRDDFDVDFVIAFVDDDIGPSDVKENIGDVLSNSNRYKDKFSEKGRAWTVNYNNSHIDIVPAKINSAEDLYITDKNDQGYFFIKSNPKAFKKWFQNQGIIDKTVHEKITESIEPIHSYQRRTILQKTVQILKYHRNKFFQTRPEKEKPISMLITTIAATLYNGESDLFQSVSNISAAIPQFMESSKGLDGNYHIYNPIETSEEFTDKWIDHPERKEAFIKWGNAVYQDLVKASLCESRIQFSQRLGDVLGQPVVSAYEHIGQRNQSDQKLGNMSFDKESGFVIGSKEHTSIPQNNFFGEN